MIQMLKTEPYFDQSHEWPEKGRHILAQFDRDSIYVYQAYNDSIADFAVEHQRFGGVFSYSRMSWIKPNFLWMMYRSGWATKEGQTRILAVRLRRSFFDEILASAVVSGFDPSRFDSRAAWQNLVATSEVRIQWDPDHDPQGRPLLRRALQLGLRGVTLRRYGEEAPVSIDDVTAFVSEQRVKLSAAGAGLLTPREQVYLPGNPAVSASIGLDIA
jgi:hypothetical protein